jgi:cellulose synthase/poly-beta-1,6-N-acetylglucosamine synthase-like glycosyltransferase
MEVTPEVSLVVTCRNNSQTIGDCLSSLAEQDYPKDAYEIVVIDANSTDGTLEIAKKFTSKVYSLPLNAAAAYNYAMKVVLFGVLGFVDADAKVEQAWLRKLVPHLSQPRVAGVSGAIETWNVENPLARSIGYEIKNRYRRIGKYTGRIATMNLLLKRSVIEEVGGWDENFPSQYDTDFGYRMSSVGYKIAYEPDAKCFHFNRPTLRAYWRQQLEYGKNTSRLYFKHGRLAKGDEITDVGMNIQPALLLAIVAFGLLGIVPLFRPLWYVSGVFLVSIFGYYLYSASKISTMFRDIAAMRLVVLYFVRACAWLCGAAVTAFRYLFRKRRKHKT